MSIQPGESIHFMTPRLSIRYVETPYKLRKEPKRFAWLARLCWKMLHKLNALEMFSEKVERWTYTQAAQEALTKKVMTMSEALWEASENPEKFVVICGALDFAEAAHTPEFRDALMFSIGPFGSEKPYRRMFNMDVHVVPYLKGVAVVPRVVIEKQSRAAA